jgi:hypothetical protein
VRLCQYYFGSARGIIYNDFLSPIPAGFDIIPYAARAVPARFCPCGPKLTDNHIMVRRCSVHYGDAADTEKRTWSGNRTTTATTARYTVFAAIERDRRKEVIFMAESPFI